MMALKIHQFSDKELTFQGWISYRGAQVPRFVPKFGLIKLGQTCLSSVMGFFCMKILLWLILYFWGDRSSPALSSSVGFSRTFPFHWIIVCFSSLDTPHKFLSAPIAIVLKH